MKKRLVNMAVAAGFALAGAFWSVPAVMATGDGGSGGGDDDQVTLCHATESETNPYVKITVDAAGAFNGHLGEKHQDGEDIIPPFEYRGETYSQNWDTQGMAIFQNNCQPVSQGQDVCPNIEGNQASVPEGMVKDDEGNCVTAGGQGGDDDVCPNIEGVQTSVPSGMVKNDEGNCVSEGDGEEEMVTICHATSSETNPYEKITIAVSGVLEGHVDHEGDIIPPFTYTEDGEEKTFAGLNWNAQGQLILVNNCEKPQDVCPNIEGNQSSVPEGMVKNDEGKCVTAGGQGGEDDICPNIEGVQTSVPSGMVKNDEGNCVTAGGRGGDDDKDKVKVVVREEHHHHVHEGGRGGDVAVAQVETMPSGGVNAGAGGAASSVSISAIFGLISSLGTLAFGYRGLRL